MMTPVGPVGAMNVKTIVRTPEHVTGRILPICPVITALCVTLAGSRAFQKGTDKMHAPHTHGGTDAPECTTCWDNSEPRVGDTVLMTIEGIVTSLTTDGHVRDIQTAKRIDGNTDRYYFGDFPSHTAEVIRRKNNFLPILPGSQIMQGCIAWTLAINGLWYSGNAFKTREQVNSTDWYKR